ncbi:MAG: IclR family transcriptional regulator [Lawsonibacter sp.]
MAGATGSVQSVDRVLDIAEVLSTVPQGMPLSDLAAATGLHISTTHRLIGVLVERGYACKDLESGKYRLTLRLFEVGSRVSSVLNLYTAAKPLLDDLASFSQEAVHLVERDGSDVVYLYKAEPSRPLVRMASYVGCRNPMFCTGVGKSILAYLPDEEVDRVWSHSDIHKYTEKTITTLDALHVQLGEIRKKGYAIDDEEHEPGVRCVAAPIFNWSKRPVAAVSISAPVFRMDEATIKQILPKIQMLSQEISQLLGYVSV